MFYAGKKVVVALSGGVDSAAAALLAQQAGCEVIAATLDLVPPEPEWQCAWGCGLEDRDLIRNVAGKLGLEHVFIDGAAAFEKMVLKNCFEEYSIGRTPNPCVLCNPLIKFGLLVEYAKSIVRDYEVKFPVYLNIDKIITNDNLNNEMKTKLIKNFLEKCSANNMYVALHGTDSNLRRVKEYCGITGFDALVVKESDEILYDGSYSVYQELDGTFVAKVDLEEIILGKGLNDSEAFANDGSYTIEEIERTKAAIETFPRLMQIATYEQTIELVKKIVSFIYVKYNDATGDDEVHIVLRGAEDTVNFNLAHERSVMCHSGIDSIFYASCGVSGETYSFIGTECRNSLY